MSISAIWQGNRETYTYKLSAGGTYLPDTNATSDTQCLPCPIGKYCPDGSTAGVDCPRGFYCIGSQASGYQNPCPLGTYGPDLGFDSELGFFFKCFMCESEFISLSLSLSVCVWCVCVCVCVCVWGKKKDWGLWGRGYASLREHLQERG